MSFPFNLNLLLTAILAGTALWLISRAARNEAHESRGRRSITYPRILRICAGLGWMAAVALPLAACRHGMIDGERSIALVTGGLGVALLFHLEVCRSRITWDGYWIYTTSPWRRDRRIAFASVTACGFSCLTLSYHIRTRKDGIIFVSLFSSGIPGLLSLLPVKDSGGS